MRNPIMHLPSSMGNNVADNTSIIFYAALPAVYSITGVGLTGDLFENVDRSQNNKIGDTIGTITHDIGFRDILSSGIVEIAVFKIERAHAVPTTDGVLLPTDATIITGGLQASVRQYQPGRVIHYRKTAIATEQPRTIKVLGNFGKFKMSKMRTGDYYGIILFNRTGSTITVDIEARYKAGQVS